MNENMDELLRKAKIELMATELMKGMVGRKGFDFDPELTVRNAVRIATQLADTLEEELKDE